MSGVKTKMAATVDGQRETTGPNGSPFDLASAETTKAKARLPEVLIGTLLVTLFALAGAWFYSSSTSRSGYLGLREAVTRGEVIEGTDLAVFELDTDAPLRAVPAGDVGLLVGKVALVDLGVGTLLTTQQVADAASIAPGFGVVGLDLAPGEFPSFTLRPGDRVRVVVVGGDDPLVLADDVEVVEVGDGNGRGRFIAVTLEADLADLVATAAAADSVRLIQVAGS